MESRHPPLRSRGSIDRQSGKARKLEFFASTFYGFFFGFALGVGCSLVVLYAIYSGGYRKALEDSLRETKSDRYVRGFSAAKIKLAAEAKSKTETSSDWRRS